jgi:hypothetical protein
MKTSHESTETHARCKAPSILKPGAKTALMDASSAILLFKGGIFDIVVSGYRVIMAASAAMEVTRPGHAGADHFAGMLADSVIAAMTPTGRPAGLPKGLHAGESDTLALYQGGCGDFIVVDDGKAAAFCRDTRIPYLNALLLPRVLHLAGRLSARERKAATRAIISVGRYADWVIQYAEKASDATLAPFFPVADKTDASGVRNDDGKR